MIIRTKLAANQRRCQANASRHSGDGSPIWHWLWPGGAEAEYCLQHDEEAATFNAGEIEPVRSGDTISAEDLRDLSTVENTRAVIANVLVRLSDMIRPATKR